MTDHLRRTGEQLRSLDRRPAGAILNGDCAYLRGLAGDYRQLGELLEPIRRAGLPLHLTMGNHDDRAQFVEVLGRLAPEAKPVEGQFVSVVPGERANWFLLDSLMEVNVVTGELGQMQLEWLDRALTAHDDKPAIIVGHHNPDFDAGPDGETTGLKDTRPLFDMLARRDHVKAYIYGHTHNWSVREHRGVHLINLPPVAYVFDESRPSGWVHARLEEDGIRLQLRSLDPDHPEHGQTKRLTWRSG